MPKDFYIFRHGQSTYNVAGRTQGCTNNSVLTELGEEQAREVGQKLADYQIDVIVSSPLKRALQTAELANQTLHVPIVVDQRFIEVNVGVVEGMHYTEIQKQYPEIFTQLHQSEIDKCFDVCYPQGETKRQVQQRLWQGLNDWGRNEQNYHNIAVSSHGIAISLVLHSFNINVNDVKNGTRIHLREDNNQWKVIKMI